MKRRPIGPLAPAPAARPLRQSSAERPLAAALDLGPGHAGIIENSHERCVALGLSRIERPDHAPLGRSDLTIARERNLRLHGHAAPVMEMLHEQIVDSESMVVLCDGTGTIIHSIGDDDFLARASKVALQPGVNWSESAKGTNAIGTALVEERPTLVHADEHFMHANHFLTCSAAPILDPRGNLLGVLDVTGDHRGYHRHTMGLVKMSARMIENQWLGDDYRHLMRLHFHGRAEFIGTLVEGILAVNPEGRIVGANRGALEQLGLSGAALRMHTLDSLLGASVGALVDRFRSPLAAPLPLQAANGLRLHVQARFNGPLWNRLAAPGAATRPAPSAASPSAPGAATPPAPGAAEAPEPAPTQTAGAPPVDAAAPLAAGPGVDAGTGAGEDLARAAGSPVASIAASGAAIEPADAADAAGGLARLLTGDARMAALVDKLRRVLDRDLPILILGESGTGKARLARAIHADSRRAARPFVAVDCTSRPEAQLEADLFGPEAGGAAGAIGRLRQAGGGTLFLHEVGALPPPLQDRLLRLLQAGLGPAAGRAGDAPLDLGLVCATRRPLREPVEAGSFGEALFHRLQGLTVKLPPLRERSDRLALARRLLEGDGAAPALRLSAEVAPLFEHYAWPGNLRQMAQLLHTAKLMAAGEPEITAAHLSDDFLEDARAALGGAADPPPARPLDDLELDAIRRAVEAAGGNITEAARRLGVSRNTIYRRLRWKPRPA